MSTAKLSNFDFRSNSIGFLRLFFALVVIWGHAYGVGGYGGDPVWRLGRGHEQAGFLAVGGFFVLSGFLITRSYASIANLGRFFWHRVLRIFPGYWVCLVVTAFGFAPLAFVHQHGTLAGFLHGPNSPGGYVLNNWLMLMSVQLTIGDLLTRLPYPVALNGSLWTLPFEFLCYMALATLGFIGVLRARRGVLLGVAIGSWLTLALPIAVFGMARMNVSVDLELLAYFFFGASAYLYRDSIPMRGALAALCAIAGATSLPTVAYPLFVPPCLAYVVLYVAMKWGPRSFDRRADLSYGTYVYAFPIQQLLVILGLNTLGFAPYLTASIAVTLALAWGSWFMVERPSLSLKNLRSPWTRQISPSKPAPGASLAATPPP